MLSGIVVLAACREATDPALTPKIPLAADVVAAAGTERQITTDPSLQAVQAISGQRIVWQDARNGNYDIYMFDLATGTERRITTDPSDQSAPAISGDRIVWTDTRNGNYDIYMFDLASGTERRITTDPSDHVNPAISGDRIVWQDSRNGKSNIYMFDLASGTERQVTTDPNGESLLPKISGDRIVWLDTRNGTCDIYMFDLASGTERRITTASTLCRPELLIPPAISGDRIVWTDTRNGNLDIYMFDLASGTERQITTDPSGQSFPMISGDRIVWLDTRNGNYDIYMFDLASGTEHRITTASTVYFASGFNTPGISGDRIVWTDVRNGNADIYMFDLSAAPLTITPSGPITVESDPVRCAVQVNLGTPTITGGAPPVTFGASPPPPYPVGTTTVTWTATDAAGNTASATQDVIVRDTYAPTVIAPPALDIPTDPGKPTASVSPGTATARDNCPGVTLVGTRSDGQALSAPYPLGKTIITWTATDASGNRASAVQPVTVRDIEPPSLTVPADFAVDATSPTGAVVPYAASARDNVAVASLTCSPASGTGFAIGTTTVTCVATDPSGNGASKSFHVTVRSAQAQLSNADNTVTSLGLPSGTATSLTTKLDAALAAANAGDVATACARLQDFINETQAQAGKKISTGDAASLIAAAQRIRAVLGC